MVRPRRQPVRQQLAAQAAAACYARRLMAEIGWYNGWSPEERRATLPLQKQALKEGRLARPTNCSICGCKGSRDWQADDAVWFHDENYADPLAAYSLCRRCHRTLHERFDKPDVWLALIGAHGKGGTAWFEHLTLDPASRYRPFAETYPDGVTRSATRRVR